MPYLFKAQLKDGSCLYQNQEDQSTGTPGKNCFYDVLQRIDEVVFFRLQNENDCWAVNLITGEFEHNGRIFLVEQGDFERATPYRLIYWKRHTHHFQTGQHDIEYIIGWQTNDTKGKNYQQTIVVS